MNAPFNPLEFSLLNDWQRDFPLVAAPFAQLAQRLGCDEATVLSLLSRLRKKGVVSRVGAVFAARGVGVGTLAALAVPPERLDEVAARVSARTEVNHNYEREHDWNLWFVANAADAESLETALADIATASACPMLRLPLVEEYHIDLGFDLADGSKTPNSRVATVAHEPDAGERRLIAALQPGLELVPRPFECLAKQAGMTEAAVLVRLSAWLDAGIVRRFGVVVRHHELGYVANAMLVFDVADDAVGTIGQHLAREAGVTLCYRRQRHLPEWPYNLFCMVHGRSREQVQPVIERLCGIVGRPGEVLFSKRRFKQRGARHFDAAVCHGDAAGRHVA